MRPPYKISELDVAVNVASVARTERYFTGSVTSTNCTSTLRRNSSRVLSKDDAVGLTADLVTAAIWGKRGAQSSIISTNREVS